MLELYFLPCFHAEVWDRVCAFILRASVALNYTWILNSTVMDMGRKSDFGMCSWPLTYCFLRPGNCLRLIPSHTSTPPVATINTPELLTRLLSNFILTATWQFDGINLLKPSGHLMHQQFNIQQLYALPTLYLCVMYLSENRQRLVPLTA